MSGFARTCRRRLALALLLAGILGPAAGVSAESGDAARIVVIRPKDGLAQGFEDGYRRHLAWHRDQQDPWTWYGWSFVLGERVGQFIDGTFGHAWSDFDQAVDPAGDAADVAANVAPFADVVSHAAYELLPALSTLRLPDSSAYLELTTYRLEPGRDSLFEELLHIAHRTRRTGIDGEPALEFAWYRLVSGGAPGEYLLMRPLGRFSDLQSAGGFFADLLDRRVSESVGTVAAALDLAVADVRSELLRFRPDLSYLP